MIPKIVLTGGPGGGKTTAINFLRKNLPCRGITPIFVPELATMLYEAGIRWMDIGHENEKKGYLFQVQMIQAQIEHEDTITAFASLVPGERKVIICDRGTIDNMAYADDSWHEDILSQVGSLGYLKRRYDGIVHLDTQAYGQGYTRENNPARYQDAEGAVANDKRVHSLWAAGPYVPHLRIGYDISLDEKLKIVSDRVSSLVGSGV